jgi:mannose-1-phosphate guanylyltransferase
VHRATACASPLEIIEVQRGDELREDDIERLADDYGRLPA